MVGFVLEDPIGRSPSLVAARARVVLEHDCPPALVAHRRWKRMCTRRTSVRRVSIRTKMSTTVGTRTRRTCAAVGRRRVPRALATITRARAARREDGIWVLPSAMRRTFDDRIWWRRDVILFKVSEFVKVRAGSTHNWRWPAKMGFIRSDWTLFGDYISFDGVPARQVLPAVRARMSLFHACDMSGLVTFKI